MDMRMTESVAWMVGLMAFLALLIIAVLVAVHVYGARAAHSDHPHAPAAVRRALLAAGASPEKLAVERGGDAVKDVGLGDDKTLGAGTHQDP